MISFYDQSTNDVKVKGEKLHPVLWKGNQWAVTTYGLECRDGTYFVKAKDFFSGCKTKREASDKWFRHISGKYWCDANCLYAAMHAMDMLFNLDGTRSDVPAPILYGQAEAEEIASQAAKQEYERVFNLASKGKL